MTLKRALVAAICATLLIAFIGPIGLIRPVQAVEGGGPNLSVDYVSGTDAVGVWSDATAASIGETVEFAVTILNTNQPSEAENLTARVDLSPHSTVYVSTTSETTVPGSQTQVSDSTSVINLPANAILQYQSGSLKITADFDGDGQNEYDRHTWGDDNLITSGINFGTLHGGTIPIVQLSFKATVLAGGDPKLTVRFLSANKNRPGDGWSDDTKANPGDPIKFYIEIHNTVEPSVAEDLKVWINFPAGEGSVFTPVAYASYAPYTSSVSDQTKITFSEDVRLTYRSGSFKVASWDQNGDGVYEYQDYAWPNGDNLIGNGIVLGDLWGCNPYIIQLSFWADSEIPETPENPDLTVNKKVVFQGNEYDSVAKETHLYDAREVVEYKIYVKNIGGQQATGVKVVDRLPAYIRTLDGHDTKEFLIGDLAAGAEWSGVYQGRVAADLPQNDRTQENVATATSDNAGSAEDTAFIWINGPEILAAETAAAAVEQLPETGPALPVALALSGLLPVGVYLRRRLI